MEKRLISHRGYKQGFLENSKNAFEKALMSELSFETDVRLSKDSVPFLIHDESLDRLFNASGRVRDYTYEELKRFSYKENSNQKLVFLQELCELIEERYTNGLIFIHIKEMQAIEPTIKVFEKYNFKDIIRFFAVNDIALDFIRLMKEKYPKYKIGLYLPEGSQNFNEESFKSVDFIWSDEINFKWMQKDKVKLAHRLGKPFYAVSPELITQSIFNKNIEYRWRELLNNGVDAICTGKPKKFLEFSKNYFSL